MIPVWHSKKSFLHQYGLLYCFLSCLLRLMPACFVLKLLNNPGGIGRLNRGIKLKTIIDLCVFFLTKDTEEDYRRHREMLIYRHKHTHARMHTSEHQPHSHTSLHRHTRRALRGCSAYDPNSPLRQRHLYSSLIRNCFTC